MQVEYLQIPNHLGEMKSKPVQQSVRTLNSLGIQPNIIVGRSELPLDKRRKERLALFCNVAGEDVISNPDVNTIYKVPLVLDRQNIGDRVLDKFELKSRKQDLNDWQNLVSNIENANRELKIAVVGKYFSTGDFQLEDVYVSVIEAIKHASWEERARPKLFWIDSDEFEKGKSVEQLLKSMDGIVFPGGFGGRGIEGIIKAIEYARRSKKPYLGLCYGMQLATVEFARNVADLPHAHTTEINPDTPHPVIHVMAEQEKLLIGREYGGTMRLGSFPCKLVKGTVSQKSYGLFEIHERHRHRYEFNNKYREKLVKSGLVISGTSPNDKLVEMIELADHPFFVGTQFHPEFKSRPLRAHPLYRAFVNACLKSGRNYK